MKMKTGTRVVFTIYLIAVIALCLFILGTIAGVIGPQNLTNFAHTAINGSIWFKILYAVIAIIVVIISFILMFFGTGKTTPKTAKVAVFESGSILITIKAIEEIVERYVREKKEVKGLKTTVVSYNDTIDINLDISVLPDADIPQITKELQAGLVDYVQKSTGITVKQTKIMVTGLKENTIKTA
ncbi:MAG: alkaline shock response membrane anchor protein AmaP [Christensenella sp.]|nr:alkaline shock response membrane anchor protein AmaP [Christensenella sp.]